VFRDATDEVVGDADVKGAADVVGEDVDIVLA
jgi:hypothetical protein